MNLIIHGKTRMHKLFFLTCIFLIFTAFTLISPKRVEAQNDSDNDGLLDSKENELAQKFAPFLHFTNEEMFFPTDINYHIDNSILYEKAEDTDTIIDASPTISSISTYVSGDYFLKNTIGSLEEIADDYEKKRTSLGDKIYAHVTGTGSFISVQYWFFYVYNPGALNQHQGDWEMMEIILDSFETPIYAAYSQHFTAERAVWNDVEKVNENHPRVYVALGSHANYFRSYQGKLGLENDNVGNAITLSPSDYQIILLGEKGIGNHPSSQEWLEYGGRWGDWIKLIDVSLGAAGPKGPGHGENEEKWSNPVVWGNEAFPVGQRWFILSWFTYHFLYIFIAILIVLVVIKLWRINSRRKQGKLNIKEILRSKKAIGIVIGIIGLLVYLVALLLPWYIVSGNIQTTALETVGDTKLIQIDGINGLRVNTLQEDQGLSQLFGAGIPFTIIFLAGAILHSLDIVGVEKSKSLARTFIISGIMSLIPVIIIIIFITQLAVIIPPIADSIGGGAVPLQIEEMANRMATSPIKGEYTGVLDYGNIALSWGLAIGSYIFIIAFILKIIAGIMTIRIQKDETS